jgi:hypothetical protein
MTMIASVNPDMKALADVLSEKARMKAEELTVFIGELSAAIPVVMSGAAPDAERSEQHDANNPHNETLNSLSRALSRLEAIRKPKQQ